MSSKIEIENEPLEAFLDEPMEDHPTSEIKSDEQTEELSEWENSLFKPPNPEAPVQFHLFKDVVGDADKEKRNDVLYIGNYKTAQRNVIFFHGDCQDYPEKMYDDEFARNWCQFNLYRVTEMLHEKFPNDNVFIIKASRMTYQAYTVYQNFVSCDEYGTPQFMTDSGAFNQISLLLQSLQIELRRRFVTATTLDKPLVLVGFSKGCVVVNQCLYELLVMTSLPSSSGRSLAKQLTAVYLLDGGHNGRTDTWVNNERVLRNLAVSTEIAVNVHVTPYQMKDADRSWISRQQKKFLSILHKHGRPASETRHFFDEPRDLGQHFKLLKTFRP